MEDNPQFIMQVANKLAMFSIPTLLHNLPVHLLTLAHRHPVPHIHQIFLTLLTLLMHTHPTSFLMVSPHMVT